MRISRKADYALRAVVILGSLPPDRTMQTQELAEAGSIPVKFLEQILLSLKRAGLLRSKRGVGGGYRLDRESRLISVAEVIEAADGELVRLIDSGGGESFAGAAGLRWHLREAEDAVNRLFRETSIEDLVRHDAGDAMVGYGI